MSKLLPRFECVLVRSGSVRYEPRKLASSNDARLLAAELATQFLEGSPQERFGVITLDTKNQLIGVHLITVGTLDCSLVHPREVFRPAILQNASSIILFHNHPSGDPTPSKADFDVTRRLKNAGTLIGIDVIDHIVIGDGATLSLAESGDC